MLGADAPMRPPKYPLESLHRLRSRQVDQAAGELARAARGRESAERARAAADRAQEAHRRAAAGVRQTEQSALEAGELRASDLAIADAYDARVRAEDEALGAQVGSAAARESEARVAEGLSRERLSLRARDAELVGKHHETWRDAQRKNAEARDEEAAFEAWRPKPDGKSSASPGRGRV
jgi:hypothetical protein